MNLTQWDKEIGAITKELLTTKKVVTQITNQSSKGIHKIAYKSEELQSRLNQNLEKIIYLSSPTEMLNPQEQGFLFWATNYAEKIQVYVKSYNLKSIYTMWAKLINYRLLGESNRFGSSLNNLQDGVTYLKSRTKRQEKFTKSTLLEIKEAEVKKEQLSIKYNELVLIKANREASGSLQQLWGNSPREALLNPLILSISNIIRKGCYRQYNANRLYFVKENQKLSHVTWKPTIKKEENKKESKETRQEDSFESLAQKIIALNNLSDEHIKDTKKTPKPKREKHRKRKRVERKHLDTNNNIPKETPEPSLEGANQIAILQEHTPSIDFSLMKDIKPSNLEILQ